VPERVGEPVDLFRVQTHPSALDNEASGGTLDADRDGDQTARLVVAHAVGSLASRATQERAADHKIRAA